MSLGEIAEQDKSVQILSDITVYMKYAKYLSDSYRRETYEELVTRNKEMHKKRFPSISDEIDKAYEFVYDKKVLPSMRSMQFAGKPIEINPMRNFNCSYFSLDDIRCFKELMFLLLSGTGVGYSVQKHHIEQLPEIRKPVAGKTKRFLVGDSIEGWADAVDALVSSYFKGTTRLRFDFSDIRPKGANLITSGGKAPGPQPLINCLVQLEGILNSKQDGEKLKTIEAHDMACHIADAVLAGGIRRAALISLFSVDDDEMMAAKTGNWWELNPQRGRANNSVVLMRHLATRELFDSIWAKVEASKAGEPGIFFTNDKDMGLNPCAEISLKNLQTCNLTEINVGNVVSQDDLNARAKAASFIGTLQAAYTDFHFLRSGWQKTTEKEALLGVSMTGIASGLVEKLNLKQAAAIVKDENKRVADLLGINPAARCTTCKPSGTTSIVFGTSSGVHAWHDKYYIRRIRVGKNEAIYSYLKENHPGLVEDEFFRPHDTAVIQIPQKAPEGAITREETALHFLDRVKFMHDNWIKPGHRKGQNTNNVSATITVKDHEWKEVGEWMWENRNSYNALSVLPADDHTYVQAPFESCTKEVYDEMMKHLTNVNLSDIMEVTDDTNLAGELACAGGACELK